MKVILIHSIIILFLAFICYWNTLHYGYVLDDTIAITSNKFTQKGFAGIKDILTHDAFEGAYGEQLALTGGRYRPLSIIMFAIEYELFGLNPFVGHFMNVLLFALTGIFIYLLLCKLLPNYNKWIPLITAIIFAVHPIHTEVVANIKSRDEILTFFLLLLTLYTLVEPSKPQQVGKFYYPPRKLGIGRTINKWTIWLFVGAIIYFLALLSKENAFTFLAVIPLTLWYFTDDKIKRIIFKTLPFICVAIIYILIRTQVVGFLGEQRPTTQIIDNPYLHASFSEKLATITYTLGKYLQLLIFPHPLSYDYSYNAIPLINWANLKAIIPLLIHLFAFYYAVKTFKRKSIISYGILFYFITISIVSNVFFNIGTSMGERFIYLSSFGFCLIFAVLLAKVFRINMIEKMKYQAKWLIPMLVIIFLACFQTISRNKVWEDNFTLYKTDIKTVPNSARARLYYGIALLNKYEKTNQVSYIEESIKQMEIACKIEPNFYHAFYNLGLAYQMKEEHDKAIKCFNRVLEIAPTHISTHACLGLLWGKGKGDYDKASYYYEKLIYTFQQKKPEYYDNLGIVYALKGDTEKAIKTFNEGIKLFPDFASLYMNLGVTYHNIGNAEKGNEYFEKAIKIEPGLKKK